MDIHTPSHGLQLLYYIFEVTAHHGRPWPETDRRPWFEVGAQLFGGRSVTAAAARLSISGNGSRRVTCSLNKVRGYVREEMASW